MKLNKVYSGKVRDIYQLSKDRLFMVATDRVSAYDVILPQLIPNKGKIITQISNFWFDKLKDIVPNHLIDGSASKYVPRSVCEEFEGRTMVVKKLNPILIESVVRGYLYGSAYDEYKSTGSIAGVKYPKNLKLGYKFPKPIFTPTTKARAGERDMPLNPKEAADSYGQGLINKIRNISFQLYQAAANFAFSRGIIIADSKFEFGLNKDDELVLMDELLTPDSSRYWDILSFKEGNEPKSMDKQIIRNWLKNSGWSAGAELPVIPDSVIKEVYLSYENIYKRLTFFPNP